MSWLPPDATWPDHGGKDARRALAQARSLGWSFRKEGHFGRIRCPHLSHDGGCELAIWGTSKDKSGSVTARKIQQKLRACEKLGGADPESVADAIAAAIPKLERLVEAAEHLRESDRLRLQMEAALDGPDTLTDDEALDQAVEADRRADEVEAAAWTAAIDASADDPWPPTERAHGLAAVALTRLEELAVTIDASDLDATLLEQIEDLRVRLRTFDL